MEDKIAVVTMRVIDFANPVPGTWTIPCDECGELTWISGIWKDKKIDQVVCKHCFFEKYKDADYTACAFEKNIEQALEWFRGRGMDVTREELIKNIEVKLGKGMKII